MSLDILADWSPAYRRVEFLVAQDFRAFCESAAPNVMGVPEIRSYQRKAIEGGVVIRYEVRQPGERDWTPVKLFQPTE